MQSVGIYQPDEAPLADLPTEVQACGRLPTSYKDDPAKQSFYIRLRRKKQIFQRKFAEKRNVLMLFSWLQLMLVSLMQINWLIS